MSRFWPLLSLGLVALLGLGLAMSRPVYAASIVVNTTADELNSDGDCSLREAITAANTNAASDACAAGDSGSTDTITFSVAGCPCVIPLASPLPAITTAITAGNLVIAGPGTATLNLSGANQVFAVNSGGHLTLQSLTVTNSLAITTAGILIQDALVNGPLVVSNGGTLGGAGTITGATTMTNGGTLNPGVSGSGILNADGAVIFTVGSNLFVDLNGLTVGSGYDQLASAGDVNLSSATLTGNVGFTDSLGDTYTIVQTSGTVSNTFAQGSSAILSGKKYSITYNSQSVVLTRVKADTTTTVQTSLTPSVFGQSVTFTATVAGANGATGTPTGTVDFVLDGGSPITVALASGQATLSTSSLAVGAHTVQVQYAGDSSFNTGSGSLTFGQIVNKASSSTDLAILLTPSVYGQTVTFTATVAALAPGAGSPTGTVTFIISPTGGIPVPQAPVALVSGVATFMTSALSVPGSPYALTATYSGDANFAPSSDGSKTQVVNKANTTTTLTTSNSNSVYGQAIIKATVTAVAPGAGTPGGTVIFHVFKPVDLTTTNYTVVLAGGEASLPALSPGTYALSVDYPGDLNFNSSADAGPLNQTISKANTSVLVAATVNPSVYGETVITATVNPTPPGAGTPTGSVTIHITGSLTADVTLPLSGGSVTLNQTLEVGLYTLTADYAGDVNFNVGASNTLNQVVNKADTTTVLSSSANPAVFGQTVIFTAVVAVVTPGVGTPTGTVTFTIDAVAQPAVTLNGAGQATLSSASLALGNHTVSAQYNGSLNFNGSNDSLAGGQDVNKANTIAAVTSAPNPSLLGSSATFTATLSAASPASGTPTGTVTFVIDGVDQAPNVTLVGGSAALTTSALVAGNHTLAVKYNGDSNFNISASANYTHTVTNTTTVVTANLNPAVFGQSVTFTATVNESLTGTPTGTVTFTIDGVAQSPVTVNGSAQATLALATLSAGSHTVSATYNGDGTFTASTGSLPTQVVNKASTTTTLASSLNPATSGQSVTFTATVVAVAPGVGIPAGTVTFSIDGVSQSPVTLDGTGKATFTTSALAVGARSIQALYNGNSNFNASTSATLTQTVNATSGGASTSTASASATATAVATPVGGQGAGSAGGTFNCSPWTVTIPANVISNNSTVSCGLYTSTVPATPTGLRLLGHTLNLNIYNSSGSTLTQFNPTLTLCYPYSDSDLVAAGGSTTNFVVVTAQIGGTWSQLTTTVNTTTKQVCATTDHLSLFDVAARVPTSAPTTGESNRFGWLILGVLGGLAVWLVARRAARHG